MSVCCLTASEACVAFESSYHIERGKVSLVSSNRPTLHFSTCICPEQTHRGNKSTLRSMQQIQYVLFTKFYLHPRVQYAVRRTQLLHGRTETFEVCVLMFVPRVNKTRKVRSYKAQ